MDKVDSEASLASLVTLGVFVAAKIPQEALEKIIKTLKDNGNTEKIVNELTRATYVDEETRDAAAMLIRRRFEALLVGLYYS